MGLAFSIDTNVLIHANDHRDPIKQQIALEWIRRLIQDRCPVAGQMLGEFLSVAHRKPFLPMQQARDVVTLLATTCSVAEIARDARIAASKLAETRLLQYFDALLCTTLESVGVTILLSEDMSDGETYGTVTVLNPFNPANADAIRAALT